VEDADEVLALVRVDAGLASDGSIDHAEHRRRHLHDPHAPKPGRGDEARKVGDRTATQPDDGVGAREIGLAEDLPAERRDLDALARLCVGHLSKEHLEAVGQFLAQRCGPGPERRRMHHQHLPRCLPEGVTELGEHAAPHDHVVSFVARDMDGRACLAYRHRCTPNRSMMSSTMRATERRDVSISRSASEA
jgi:hypothetical protein